MHPAPGSEGRPSFTALVASVDSDTSRYVAECRAQTGRVEMIENLQDMAVNVLKLYRDYRLDKEKKPFNPKRIIFYRDGVSEGEFRQVLQRGELTFSSLHSRFSRSASCRIASTAGYALIFTSLLILGSLTRFLRVQPHVLRSTLTQRSRCWWLGSDTMFDSSRCIPTRRTPVETVQRARSSTATSPTQQNSTFICKAIADKYTSVRPPSRSGLTRLRFSIRCGEVDKHQRDRHPGLRTTVCYTTRTSSPRTVCKPCRMRYVTSMLARPAPYQSPRQSTVRTLQPHYCGLAIDATSDAGIVCARGKLHYVPGGDQGDLSESAQLSPTEAEQQMEAFRSGFKPVHSNTRYLMYFS